MSVVFYILMGTIDVLALFALMFRSFQLSYFEYFKEITIVAITTAIVSYVVRIYLNIPFVYDAILHYVLYIIFFRYLIKVKFMKALIIGIVYFVYGISSSFIYVIYYKTNLFAPYLFDQPMSAAIYAVQITQIMVAVLIAYILFRFNLGLSFIIRPPHDFVTKSPMHKKDLRVVVGFSLIGIIVTMLIYWMVHSKNFIIIPLNMICFLVIIYLAYRRDVSYDRSNRTARFQAGQENERVGSR